MSESNNSSGRPRSELARTARCRVADRGSRLAEKLWPRDVVRTILFLASDDAAAITGATLEVFGGTHLTIQP